MCSQSTRLMEKHIVLDLDGTLVDHDGFGNMYLRPGAMAFVQKCFKSFQTVSIWTAAKKSWLELFLMMVEKAKIEGSFLFTWSWSEVTTQFEHNNKLFRYAKDLRKMWNHPEGLEACMTKDNTILLDDHEACRLLWPHQHMWIAPWSHVEVWDKKLAEIEQYLF